jgi:hypothetical protein
VTGATAALLDSCAIICFFFTSSSSSSLALGLPACNV